MSRASERGKEVLAISFWLVVFAILVAVIVLFSGPEEDPAEDGQPVASSLAVYSEGVC